MELAFVAARPAVAILVLLWASAVVPSFAGLAVASAVTWFAAPFAVSSAPAAWLAASPSGLLVEVVRGAALGLAAAAPLWAASTAGGWAGQRWRGAGAGSPMTALYAAMLGVAFLAVDGPALVCAALVKSYAAAPLGAPLAAGGLELAGAAGWVVTAVRLSLPVLLAVAIAELGVAAGTRAAGAAAGAWPSAALAPAVVLLITAPLVPLLVAAMAAALRGGLAT
jgi:type III secretory pathway component EscT